MPYMPYIHYIHYIHYTPYIPDIPYIHYNTPYIIFHQHEGPVTSIRISSDGRRQAVGTAVGTLGILNVTEHSYNTVLRSHTGSITAVSKRGCGHEFATLGKDHTIRVWDIESATQIIEVLFMLPYTPLYSPHTPLHTPITRPTPL